MNTSKTIPHFSCSMSLYLDGYNLLDFLGPVIEAAISCTVHADSLGNAFFYKYINRLT